jgi:crotonobetaine/carnitine-CoA ligase
MQIQGLARRLQVLARETPDRIFANTSTGPLTFQTLATAADGFAQRYYDRGLRKGDRVIVMMANSLPSLAIIHGLLRAGLVWVPVNPALVGASLAHVIRTVEPSLIVCDHEVTARLSECAEAEGIPVDPIQKDELPPAILPLSAEFPDPGDLASIMFTSGTTGPAKGVMVSHMMLELAAQSVALCGDVKTGDNMFVWEPFYHIGGAQVLMVPLLRDVHLTIADRFSASRFWQQVAEAECTHIHHLGGIIQILLKQAESPWERNHKVRVAWGGGCAPIAWRPFEQRFAVQIRECYGMTECSSLTTWNNEGVVGSVGRAMPWFEIELKDENGSTLKAGEGPGEIVVRTTLPGAITQGYYGNPAATAKALQPDGFHTGDLGSWDDDGMLFFLGRMTDSVRCRARMSRRSKWRPWPTSIRTSWIRPWWAFREKSGSTTYSFSYRCITSPRSTSISYGAGWRSVWLPISARGISRSWTSFSARQASAFKSIFCQWGRRGDGMPRN